jgi:predicted transcriptional regulator
MAARKNIDVAEVANLLGDGKSQSEIARILGVTPSTVTRLVKKGNVLTATSAMLTVKEENHAAKLIERHINTMDQLIKVNDYANEMLDMLMKWNRGEEVALQVLENQVKMVRVGAGKDVEWIKEYKFKDPRELAQKLMAEIRGQLQLQLEIYKTLYDRQAVANYQQKILAFMDTLGTDVRTKFLHFIARERFIQSVV